MLNTLLVQVQAKGPGRQATQAGPQEHLRGPTHRPGVCCAHAVLCVCWVIKTQPESRCGTTRTHLTRCSTRRRVLALLAPAAGAHALAATETSAVADSCLLAGWHSTRTSRRSGSGLARRAGTLLAVAVHWTPADPGADSSRTCSRFFVNEAALNSHRRTKPHKRRLKELQGPRPHDQREADWAGGVLPASTATHSRALGLADGLSTVQL